MRYIFVFFLLLVRVFAAILASDGSQSDVNAKISAATAGDVVTIPPGSFPWGASNTAVTVNKAITLSGAGEASTTIVLTTDGPAGTSAAIQVSAAAMVSGFTITGALNGSNSTTPFSVISATGFRVHHITYNSPNAPGYFCYCGAAKGLFDHLTLNSLHGSQQLFTIRGDKANHNAAHTMGSGDGVYIEDCTFSGLGYVNESEGGAQTTARFNTITGEEYFDSHQFETSTCSDGTTQHGSRQMEVYNNIHTTSNYSDWCVLSAGANILFDNYVVGSIGRWQTVNEYGAHGDHGINSDGSGYIPTPAHSPIPDQIGTGKYTAGVQTAGDEPVYFFNNRRSDGTDMALFGKDIGSGAIAAYGSTFYMTSLDGSPSMFLYGRDFLTGVSLGTFPSTSQIGRGTKAQMLASSPTAARQGWYVTDEGSWYQKWAGNKAATAIAVLDRCQIVTVGTTDFTAIGASANTVGVTFIANGTSSGTGVVSPFSGQLYVWTGSAWVLSYTPHVYPHELQGASSTPANPANYRKVRTMASGL